MHGKFQHGELFLLESSNSSGIWEMREKLFSFIFIPSTLCTISSILQKFIVLTLVSRNCNEISDLVLKCFNFQTRYFWYENETLLSSSCFAVDSHLSSISFTTFSSLANSYAKNINMLTWLPSSCQLSVFVLDI